MYNNNTFSLATIMFVTFLLIGTGLVIYYAIDITAEYRQLEQRINELEGQVNSCTSELTKVRAENQICSINNAALKGEEVRLQNELNLALSSNTTLTGEVSGCQEELAKTQAEKAKLQAYVDGSGYPDIDELRLENLTLSLALEQCRISNSDQQVLQSSILPKDPVSWLIIALVIFAAAAFQIIYVHYLRRKVATFLQKQLTERELSSIKQQTNVIDGRFLH